MRTIIKRSVIYVMLIALGFAGGTIFGFFNGLHAFALLDAAPKGLVAVSGLHTLEKGDTEHVKVILESDVDNSLAFYSMLNEAPWFPAYQRGWLFADPAESEKLIRRVATYRKSHPSPFRVDAFDKVPEGKEQYASDYAELAQGSREHHRRVDEMVERYAEAQPDACKGAP